MNGRMVTTSMKRSMGMGRWTWGRNMRIIRGMETPNPTMIRFLLSCRSFSRASRSRSAVSSPSMPRYW
jgi:hypothetical protein